MFFKKKQQFDPAIIPRHIGIIMDGNGRWARRRGLPRSAGHRAGAEALRVITEYCAGLGVAAITAFAFSTENWNRPPDEVDALMKLLAEYINSAPERLAGKNQVIRVIGDRSKLSDEINKGIDDTENLTKNNTGLVLNLAINYGGQDEIIHAVKNIAGMAVRGEIEINSISGELFERQLYTYGLPPVDLIIRPSGEKRLSNFLLWQAAYAELWYSDILWPDFSPRDMDAAIADFGKRDRRFGEIRGQD